jgi:hypothetical protein
MPVEKTHEKKEPEKKEKVNMGKRAYDLLNAERMRVAREERLAAAEEQRQRDRQHELRMIKEKVERDPLPGELTEEHDIEVICRVVGKAAGVGYEGKEASEVRELMVAKMDDVDVGGLPDDEALLVFAEVIAARKAAKAADKAFERKLKEEEKAAAIEAAAEKKAAKAAEKAAKIAAAKAAKEEKEAKANAAKFGDSNVEFGCVNSEIPDFVDTGKPLTKEEKKAAKKKAAAEKARLKALKREEEEKAGLRTARTNKRQGKAKVELTEEEKEIAERAKFAAESGIDAAGARRAQCLCCAYCPLPTKHTPQPAHGGAA